MSHISDHTYCDDVMFGIKLWNVYCVLELYTRVYVKRARNTSYVLLVRVRVCCRSDVVKEKQKPNVYIEFPCSHVKESYWE